MSIICGKIGILFWILPIIITNNIVNTNSAPNNLPIIGILAQETDRYDHLIPSEGVGKKSYIAASYVKFIEGAGARVIPIWIGKSESYYRHILGQINGVLWPGGSASFDKENGYADAGKIIYKIAKEMKNQHETHFPILGICLGMELLTTHVVTGVFEKFACSSQSQALSLNFIGNVNQSKLFKNASDITKILANEKVTINFHKFCVKRKANKEVKYFRIISENKDENDTLFISSLEHKNYPFYGLQFHPEKNIYEWIKGKHIPHTSNAIKVSQYFANFFVNEARKNNNRFSDQTEKVNNLIYNYSPIYVGKMGSSFEQIYLFSEGQ